MTILDLFFHAGCSGFISFLAYRVGRADSTQNYDPRYISQGRLSTRARSSDVAKRSRKLPFKLGVVGHFGLAVRNPKKSAKWFERALGLQKEFDFDQESRLATIT